MAAARKQLKAVSDKRSGLGRRGEGGVFPQPGCKAGSLTWGNLPDMPIITTPAGESMLGNTNKLGRGLVLADQQDELRQLTSKARLAAAARLKPRAWREELALNPDFLGLGFTKS